MRPRGHEPPAGRFVSVLVQSALGRVWAAELRGSLKLLWRIVRFAVFALIGGAVASVSVAEGIGASGVVRYDRAAPQRFVAVAGKYVQARDMSGIGWRYLWWEVKSQDSAAVAQYMYDKHIDSFEGMLLPSYLHCDPPGSLPAWSRLWRPESWPHEVNMGGYIQSEMAMEVGAGWPLPSITMDWDSAHRNEYRGGKVLPSPPGIRMRFLAWRPLARGLAVDTLFYAAALAGLVGGARLVVRARRRRRGVCPACAYDLRGLAADGVCPECGRPARLDAGAVPHSGHLASAARPRRS
jgi:hypothetical protein